MVHWSNPGYFILCFPARCYKYPTSNRTTRGLDQPGQPEQPGGHGLPPKFRVSITTSSNQLINHGFPMGFLMGFSHLPLGFPVVLPYQSTNQVVVLKIMMRTSDEYVIVHLSWANQEENGASQAFPAMIFL